MQAHKHSLIHSICNTFTTRANIAQHNRNNFTAKYVNQCLMETATCNL